MNDGWRTATPGTLPETPDHDGAFPRLDDDHIRRLERMGRRRRTEAGEVLFREGDEDYDFFVVLEGRVAIVAHQGTEERLFAVHGPGRFLGELGLLTGQAALFTAVVHEPGEVLQVPAQRVRELVAEDVEFCDLVLRAYIQRREMLIGIGAGLTIIGSHYSPEARRLREFAARNRLPHRWVDLERDAEAEALLQRLGVPPQDTPVVIWRGTEVLRNPSPAELARVLGLRRDDPHRELCDLVVVGAGPAGLAASVYGASEGLATVSVEGTATGGQAATSSRIENYLGFPSGISGAELADRARVQADKFGARITVPAEATGLQQHDDGYVVTLDDGSEVAARAVVIATGAQYRRLPVPRLEEFEQTSVYYAATVTEAQACAGDPIVIVGGGNSAGQATMFLSRNAASVRLVVRDGDLAKSMSRYLVDRIEHNPKVEVMTTTEVRQLLGDGTLEAVVVENNRTGEREIVEAKAMFVFIGARPRTGWLDGQVALDDKGFVLTGQEAAPPGGSPQGLVNEFLETSLPGIFAAGDVRHGSIKRVASAVGEGSMSVRLVHDHLGSATGVAPDTHAHHTNVSSK
jgi:thioredoxin reductase (NADPH)